MPKIEGLRRIARTIRNVCVPRATILLYHRVGKLSSDPQLLCVSSDHFAEHLEILRRYGRTIQLRSLDQALRYGHVGRRTVIVTFDDGYADNLYNAKPLLQRYDIAATVFVTAGYVGAGKEFWSDALERLLLQPGTLPDKLCVKVNGTSYRWELGEAAHYSESSYRQCTDWNVLRKDNPTRRHELYRAIFQVVVPLPDAERRTVVDELQAWAGVDAVSRSTHRILSEDETIRLGEGGLVEIGSHTMNHPVLSELPRSAQVEEISRSKARLGEILGRPVDSFAYPYGGRSHYTRETVAAVREAGYSSACSNFDGDVQPGTDRWELPRLLVRDWDGEEFSRRLFEWFRI